ncbi:hypothetical protein JXQ31_20060 [candidate division KSB1 bacterium]|nr:hypothetical protein [candidate division KSB1 bacterium]
MYYLIGEILLYLIIAAIWGFLFGWFLQKMFCSRTLEKADKVWKINVLSLEQELEKAHNLLKNNKINFPLPKSQKSGTKYDPE